jgi:hypothetical protein
MPYFLVSHTALVEADDEASAAAKVYGEICDKENITFSVTADEHVTTKITIPTRTRTDRDALGSASLFPKDRPFVTPAPHESDAPIGNSDRSTSVLAGFSRLFKGFRAHFKRQ